jgi:hypothetical protein
MDTVRFSQIVESSGKPDTHLLLIDPAKDKTLQAAIKSNRVMTVYQGSRDTKTDYGTIGFAEGPSRQFLIFPKTLKPFADKRVIGIKYELLESIPVSQDETTSEPKSDKASKPTRDQAPTEVDRQPATPKRGLSDDVSDEARSDVCAMTIKPAKSEASSNLRTAPNSGRSPNKPDKPADDQPDRRPKSLAEVAVVKPAGTAQSKKKPSASVYAREKKPAPGAPPEKVVEFPKPEPNAQPVVRSDEVERLKRRVREAIDVLEQGKQVAAYNLLKSIVEE